MSISVSLAFLVLSVPGFSNKEEMNLLVSAVNFTPPNPLNVSIKRLNVPQNAKQRHPESLV